MGKEEFFPRIGRAEEGDFFLPIKNISGQREQMGFFGVRRASFSRGWMELGAGAVLLVRGAVIFRVGVVVIKHFGAVA
jgi:hypothetical protein